MWLEGYKQVFSSYVSHWIRLVRPPHRADVVLAAGGRGRGALVAAHLVHLD
jgi:hypothetical protein